jgi:hypothetical protein
LPSPWKSIEASPSLTPDWTDEEEAAELSEEASELISETVTLSEPASLDVEAELEVEVERTESTELLPEQDAKSIPPKVRDNSTILLFFMRLFSPFQISE